MTLGGDGNLNLPFEPTERVDVEAVVVIAGGVIVRPGVMAHPVSGEPHPVLLLTFSAPDGTLFSDFALVVERSELEALKALVADTVDAALAAYDQWPR